MDGGGGSVQLAMHQQCRTHFFLLHEYYIDEMVSSAGLMWLTVYLEMSVCICIRHTYTPRDVTYFI